MELKCLRILLNLINLEIHPIWRIDCPKHCVSRHICLQTHFVRYAQHTPFFTFKVYYMCFNVGMKRDT